MSKISGWNFSQNITSADNCKQKNEDLDTWYVGMGSDSNLLIVFYVQIMPDDLVMQLHRF